MIILHLEIIITTIKKTKTAINNNIFIINNYNNNCYNIKF